MAPSEESRALADLYTTFAQNFALAKGANMFLERAIYDQAVQAGAEAPNVHFEYVTIVGRPCLWARPQGASKQHVMLFMHGGGYTVGSPNSHRKLQAHLARACNMPSLSIDYRMTPEVTFPIPLDDCVDVYQWLLEHGYAANKIVMAGDPCGGALAVSVPLRARERGLSFPGAVVALSPWMDLTGDSETEKTNAHRDAFGTPEFLEVITDRFTGNDKSLRKNPLVSPLFADVKDLPSHWISCAGHDMLLDHGTRMAEKLKASGVDVVLEVHEGQQHVFELMAGKAPEADESIRKIGKWGREKIGS